MPNIRTRARIAVVALLIGLTSLIVTSSSASAAPVVNTIHDCGIVTCSDYYSHAATVEFDRLIQKGDVTTAANTGTICTLGAAGAAAFKLITAATAELIIIPCSVIGTVAGVMGNVQGIIHHAATSNGCMRFRHPRGANSVSVAVYADHSATCHKMDA